MNLENIDKDHGNKILPGKFPVPLLHTVGIITSVGKEHLGNRKRKEIQISLKETKANLKEDKELSTDGNGQGGEHIVMGGQAAGGCMIIKFQDLCICHT